MERSAAYKWAGHVVPGSWLDREDHMAHAGEEEEGAGVGVVERGAGVRGGWKRSTAERWGRGWWRKGADSLDACAGAGRRDLELLSSRPRPRSASPTRLYNLSARRLGHEEFSPRRRHGIRRPQGYETITAQDLLTTTGNYNSFISARE